MKMIFQAEGFVNTDNPTHYVSEHFFNLEKSITSMNFEFFGNGKELFFHVKDPSGLLRIQHLSSSVPSFVILHVDEEKSGTGTCFGKIDKGQWKIIAFSYAPRYNRMWGEVPFNVKVFEGMDDNIISGDTVSWIYRDEYSKGNILLKDFESENIELSVEKWIKGDFHAHTTLSDGNSSPSKLIDEGVARNLDFFFITEHNILTPGFPEREGITVFPSFETTTIKGHFNAIGLRYMPEWLLSKGPSPSWKDLENLIKDFRAKGVLISINHPFSVPWHWQYIDLPLSFIDSIEIITNPYYENLGDANEKAFSFIDLLWNNGCRITGLGGSDTHTSSTSQLGQPVTEVFAKIDSLSSMLEGIRNHCAKIFVELECDFEYRVNGKMLLPGTDIGHSGNVNIEFALSLEDDSEAVNLRVIENGIPVDEKKAFPGEKTQIHRVWKDDSDWIRCEIRDNQNRIRGYINPLHRGEKEGIIKTWGGALEAFGSQIHKD